jgi:hypothetical protein
MTLSRNIIMIIDEGSGFETYPTPLTHLLGEEIYF